MFEPNARFSFGIDFWWFRLENSINVVAEQAIFGDPAKYSSRFFRCSQASPALRDTIDVCLNFPTFDPIAFIHQPTENLGNINTNGLDINLRFRSAPTPYGQFGVALDGTYIDKYEFQREKGGVYIQNVGNYGDTAPIFRWQHILTFSYANGPWSGHLVNKYKAGYEDQTPPNQVGDYSTWDLFGTWTGLKGLTITAGIRNLFDQDPPFTNQDTTFQRGYDPRFTDPLGCTFLVRASYKFF